MITGKNRYPRSLALILLVLLYSCHSNSIYTETVVMPDNKWELMNVPSFRVPVNDTLEGSNVYFTIRTGSSYPFRNIFLFVKTTAPDGKSITDTMEYYLSDPRGKWYGKGFGDIREMKLPYRMNVYFPHKGIYRFDIQHGMRVEDLEGVYDFGLKVTKTEK
jgi:gliding motility-associated lipoprotein GldH